MDNYFSDLAIKSVFIKLATDHLGQKRMVRLVVLAISLLLFSLIVGAILLAVKSPYSGLDLSLVAGTVEGVAANSPAAAAGFRPGDVILAIDDQPWQQAAAHYATVRSGESMTLLIQRDGRRQLIPLNFTPLPRTERLKRLSPLLVALGLALFSFFVWAYEPYDSTIILYLSLNYLGTAVLTFGALTTQDILWALLGFTISLCTLSPLLIHFHLHFTRPDWRIRRGWILGGLYALALTLVIWQFASFWSPQDRSNDWLASRAIRSYFVLASLASAALLVQAYFAGSLSQQRRIRLVVIGTIIAFIPLIGLALLPSLLTGQTLIAYEFTFPFLLLGPVAYGIAIYRYNLLDIDRLINRSVVHLTLLLILAVVYLGLATGLSHLWPGAWVGQPWVWGGVTLLFAAIFAPLRNRLQAVADRLFYGGWYDYRSVVGEMSQALGGIVDGDELAQLLVNRLPHILRLDGAALLLHQDENKLSLVKATGCNSLPPDLSVDGALSAKLRQMAQPLPAVELRAALEGAPLTDEEESWLGRPQLNTWVPLIRHGKLRGALLLCPRPGGEPFDAEDKRMLGTLAWGAAIAAENVQLVSNLRRRSSEVDQLYSQLMQSREAERKRLARELHDQVIQDMINLHHYLDTNAPRLGATAVENARALRERSQAIINDLRQICTDLRPATLDDLSLGLAMQGYVDDIAENEGMDISITLIGKEDFLSESLPEDVKVCLFRVLQEAVTNVRRHAQADHTQVKLAVMPDHVALEIRDDGQGFQCPAHLGAFTREGHFGLAGLQERLNLIAGAFWVESIPGQGTTLHARAPLNHNIEGV